MVDLVQGLDIDTVADNDDEFEFGGGGGRTVVGDEEGYNVAITIKDGVNIGQTIEPVYTKRYSGDSFGTHSVLTDGCGNTQTRRGSGTGFQITLEGILTIEQLREAKRIELNKGTLVDLSLQPWQEEYIVKQFSWDKPSDLNKWYSPEFTDGVEAFTYQLQTRDPTNESNGGF